MIIVMAVACSAPLEAKTQITFAAYVGTGSNVIQGKGGTRITDHGIDYWTTGDPPRPFHYLGVLKVVGGDPIGRRDVAAAAKEAGGDAVVLKRSETRSAGNHGVAAPANLGGGLVIPAWTRDDNETTSVLAVIKYLE